MSQSCSRRRHGHRALWFARAVLCLLPVLSVPAWGQTDFANTDAGRPFRTQDAIVLERYAIEAHLPGLQLRTGAGPFALTFDPALAIGILPRTQLDLGVSVTSTRRLESPLYTSAPSTNEVRRLRLEEVHAGVLHQLNVETLSVPAIALGAEVDVPVGADGGSPEWSGLVAATRTWGGARTHLNARVTSARFHQGDAYAVTPWEVGLAVDRTLPLQHLLWGAELGVERHDAGAPRTAWYTGAGLRWQWTMRTSVDAGVTRHFDDGHRWAWSLGMSTGFGLRSFTRGYR